MNKLPSLDKGTMEFRVETVNLLEEIFTSAMRKSDAQALRIPINIFRKLLVQVAVRATELNDPKLNILMLKLGLYNVNPEDVPEEIANQKKLI